jgi:hypothetical protein
VEIGSAAFSAMFVLHAAVGVSAVRDAHHENNEFFIINGEDDAVGAYSIPVKVRIAGQLDDGGVTRIFSQSENPLGDPTGGCRQGRVQRWT